ncbi:MAG: hypothetical protein KAR11_08550 [Phycisphaerae bacterium]|nr:hypothetical protein [Phycisphaerae bacterium]
MLKLLLYGYSYGVRSSRKLERETHYYSVTLKLSGKVFSVLFWHRLL